MIYWVIYYCRYSFEGCQMPPNHQAIIIWWSSQGWHILCFTLVFGRFEATKLIGFLGQSLTFCWKSYSKASNVSGQKLHQDSWFICWGGFLVDWSCEWKHPMELGWDGLRFPKLSHGPWNWFYTWIPRRSHAIVSWQAYWSRCVLRDGESCWVICCCMLLSRFQTV